MELLNKILNSYNIFSEERVKSYEEINGGVSDKLIIRIFTKKRTIIGIYNSNIKENSAFLGFTKIFNELNLNVPKVLFVSDDNRIYFLNDLGKDTLFDFIKKYPQRNAVLSIQSKVIDHLVKFQVFGAKKIDFRLCYETMAFDKLQIDIDVSKFKKYFLKRFLNNQLDIPDNNTLNKLMQFTIYNSKNYFMYRDFQPRNIVLNNEEPFFVDYQSGRLGPPQYDLISFLYSGSNDLSNEERTQLKKQYYSEFSKYEKLDKDIFFSSLDYFALLRIIQILGSYCYSYYNKNSISVLNKIPIAINNLKTLNLDKDLNNFRNDLINLYFTHISKHQ